MGLFCVSHVSWSSYGTIEPSAEAAIAAVATHSEWLDLSNHYFVLLGAGAAMGPLEILLEHGANIIAVDLDRAGIWTRLLTAAANSCGTMTFPLSKPLTDAIGKSTVTADDIAALAPLAGCNLFTHTPEIKNWVSSVHSGHRLVIGGYAYLDSAAHVQVCSVRGAFMRAFALSSACVRFVV